MNQYKPITPDIVAQAKRFVKQVVFGYPSMVIVEVSKACNRRCVYCPQSVAPTKQDIMEPKVWEKIVSRLTEAKWQGLVGFVEYNELSLVPESDRYIREMVAIGCHPVIYSNGDRPEVVKTWIDAGAYRIVITQHPPTSKKWEEGVDSIVAYAKSKGRKKVVSVRKIVEPDNRGGLVEGTSNKRIPVFDWLPFVTLPRCWYFSSGMNIRLDGGVSICCVDYHTATNFGNVVDKPLWDVWFGKLYAARRKSRRGVPSTKICGPCLE